MIHHASASNFSYSLRVLELVEGVHVVLLLLEGDVAAEQLVLVGDLREEFLVEADLLDQADDRLLLLVLQR